MKKTVYISNLSYDRDRAGLKYMFSKFGTVKNIKIIVDPKTDQSKGMAFVEMSTAAEAKAAIEGLNGKVVDGRTLKANYATQEKPVPLFNRSPEAKEKKVKKEPDFKEKQLAKKARNDAKRKANPFIFKKSKTKS